MTDKFDRRSFIKTTAVGVASVGAGATLSAKAATRIIGANERLNIGVIGTGRQGLVNLRDFIKQPDVEVVALCDVYAPNLEKASKLAPAAQTYMDYRRVLERKDINAVIVATPDHWHALPMVQACEAGKDVYVEKPVSLTIEEGRKMVRAARKHNRIVQTGTQQRSGAHFQRAVEIVRGGELGKVSFVRTWKFGNEYPNGIGNPPNTQPPPDLDWEMWLGPAPQVPFNANRFGVKPNRYSDFRWFWDYAGGLMTDWGVHLLDIVQWAMNVDYPQSINAMGGKFFLQDNRETPDTLQVAYQYPHFVCTFETRACNAAKLHNKAYGIAFHGSEATLIVDRGGYEIIPEPRRRSNDNAPAQPDTSATMSSATPPEAIAPQTTPPATTLDAKPETTVVKNSNDQHATHVRNFLDCVKSRQKPICDIEIGHRSSSAALLGNVAYRAGRQIQWDGRSEQIIGDRAASRYLSKDYRKPWTLKV